MTIQSQHPHLTTPAISLAAALDGPPVTAPELPPVTAPVAAPPAPTWRSVSVPVRKPRGSQFSARSPRTPIEADTRPALTDLQLPGPRREQEGRGGAVATTDTLRLLIRSPLLAAFTAAIPRRNGGRRAAMPDVFWIFYLAANRELASAEKLDQELRAHWPLVREEFWFEHGVLLPDAKPNGDVPNSDDFRKWRRRNIVNRPGQLPALRTQLTTLSIPLALAIRRAEGGDVPRDLLTPAVWDCIAADGTVLNAPSDVRERWVLDKKSGLPTREVFGSRAKDRARARIHHPVGGMANKGHGAKTGLFNVAAVTKGLGSYTRVVLGVDVGAPGMGECGIAMRVLRAVYDQTGTAFPVLLYDGAIVPVHYQELMAAYGVYCVNANHSRPKPPTPKETKAQNAAKNASKTRSTSTRKPTVSTVVEAPDTPWDRLLPDGKQAIGQGRRRYGRNKGELKRTYATPLPSVNHHADGYVHQHHLTADDGAVYETNRPALAGGDVRKIAPLRPCRLERKQEPNGEFYLRLTLAGDCQHGGPFQVSYDLRRTTADGTGSVPWRELVANVRVLPDALTDHYAEVFGRRNQVESFFSWLERCFWVKDRHASWGREAQLLDLLGAALLHNSIAWAHLAYRHPQHAQQLRTELNDLAARGEATPAATAA